MITFDQNDEGQAILKPLLHCKHKSQHCSREGILTNREPKAIFLSVLCFEAAMLKEGEVEIPLKNKSFHME